MVPSRDQTVAVTSNENVTYECVVDGGRSVFWNVQNNPLEGVHIGQFESIGIYKQDSPQGNSSVLIVSQTGRETYHNTGQDIEIQCRAFQQSPPLSGFSDVFYIITYGELFWPFYFANQVFEEQLANIILCLHSYTDLTMLRTNVIMT